MAQNGNRIRDLREAAHATPTEVGAKVGKSAATISRYERGEVAVPDDVKHQLAALFAVSVPWLMGWDEKPTRKAAA